MSLIGLLVAIVLIALIVYVVQRLALPEPFRTVIYVLVVLVLVLWLVGAIGGIDTGLRLEP